jgi:hypothetical protein
MAARNAQSALTSPPVEPVDAVLVHLPFVFSPIFKFES